MALQVNRVGTESDFRFETLASRLRGQKRPTFHTFEYRGDMLLYDLLSGTLLQLSRPTYLVLNGIEHKYSEEVVKRQFQAEGILDSIDAVVSTLNSLADEGMFREEPSPTPRQRARTIKSLMSHRPRKMMLMVQTNCNLKCSYCYEVLSGFHSTGKSMSLDAGKRSVDFLITRSGSRKDIEITFFGGEPLMNFPLIKELVDYSRTKGTEVGKSLYFQLTTNATLLTDEVIEFLVRHDFTIMVSLDGPPELSDIHRKDLAGKGVASKAIENALRLVSAQRAAGQRPAMIRATMTHENHDSRSLYAYFKSLGFTRVMLGVSNGRATEKGPWDVQGEDILDLSAGLDTLIDDFVRSIDENSTPPPGAESIPRNLSRLRAALDNPSVSPSIGCGVGRNMQAFSASGNIYPCHRYAGEDSFLLGSVDKGIDAARLRKYYKDVLDVKEDHCSKCWARFTCGGQCPWYISKATGEVGHPDEESCNGIRQGQEKQLWLINELAKRQMLHVASVEEGKETE